MSLSLKGKSNMLMSFVGEDGERYKVTLDIHHHVEKGFISGLPEDCYEGYEEFEYHIESFHNSDGDEVSDVLHEKLEEEFEEEFTEDNIYTLYMALKELNYE